MAFLESIKRIATGKTEVERRQEAAAQQIIRRKAIAAGLRERERQAIRSAAERERIIAQRKLERFKNPPRLAPITQGFGSSQMTNIISGRSPAPNIQRVRVKSRPKKKRKTSRPQRTVYIDRPVQPQRFEVI